jgi:hypothetical protein
MMALLVEEQYQTSLIEIDGVSNSLVIFALRGQEPAGGDFAGENEPMG